MDAALRSQIPADSGRKLLAATRAAGGDDATATDSGHAGAKAVAALAHEFAGLISPLHGYAPVWWDKGRLTASRELSQYDYDAYPSDRRP